MLKLTLQINDRTIYRILIANKGVPHDTLDNPSQPRQYLCLLGENNGFCSQPYDVIHNRTDGALVLIHKVLGTILKESRQQ